LLRPMSGDFSPELRRELLDDFYAECDELLTSVREGLAQLESAMKNSAPQEKILEGLFRSIHSVKGNSAIVGLRSAEELAHGMEDLLRAMSKQQVAVSETSVDGLLAGTQCLGKIVVAHRLKKAPPKTAVLLQQFRAQLAVAGPDASPATPAPAAPITVPPDDPVALARQKGLAIYIVSFAPSPALDQRGINVAAVRERLAAIGEIIRATPIVLGKGSIMFEFVVGLRELPADPAGWTADGVVFRMEQRRPQTVPVQTAASEALASLDGAETLSLTPSHIVRVDLARLDELMRITGEMVIHRSRLEERIQPLSDAHPGLKEVNLALSRSLREMRAAITRVRMVPIAELFTRMPFVVRDLVRESGRKIGVVLLGEQTEVDKFLVERLKEPLLHLVRNAVSHGIESPAERQAAGKSAEAVITLQARSAGEFVIIQVRDDGRGIDAEAVLVRARVQGLAVPDRLTDQSLLEVLCAPGFSTRDQADLASGRGVGMAVVANTVRELGGVLTLKATLGQGTAFTLKLPLTLSITDAIIVEIGTQVCAVPQSAVDEIVQLPAGELRSIRQTEVVPYRQGLLPVVRLQGMFGAEAATGRELTLLVTSSDRGAVGLLVNRVRSQREIVVRPLADPLLRVRGISGATELGDGRPILILDPSALTQGVTRVPNSEPVVSPLSEAHAR
jgi:two-component system chemotaxis sensor kinase CheA